MSSLLLVLAIHTVCRAESIVVVELVRPTLQCKVLPNQRLYLHDSVERVLVQGRGHVCNDSRVNKATQQLVHLHTGEGGEGKLVGGTIGARRRANVLDAVEKLADVSSRAAARNKVGQVVVHVARLRDVLDAGRRRHVVPGLAQEHALGVSGIHCGCMK